MPTKRDTIHLELDVTLYEEGGLFIEGNAPDEFLHDPEDIWKAWKIAAKYLVNFICTSSDHGYEKSMEEICEDSMTYRTVTEEELERDEW